MSNVTFDELEPVRKQLDLIAKKNGLEYQLIVGFKDFSFYQNYYGEKEIINKLDSPTLCRTFLVPQGCAHHHNDQ